MSFDPEAYLALAAELAGDPSGNEAKYRSAVSRAYYAVFLKARETLLVSGRLRPTNSGSDHSLVIAALRRVRQGDADQLSRLRRGRNRADYNLQVQVLREEATKIVANASALWRKI